MATSSPVAPKALEAADSRPTGRVDGGDSIAAVEDDSWPLRGDLRFTGSNPVLPRTRTARPSEGNYLMFKIRNIALNN